MTDHRLTEEDHRAVLYALDNEVQRLRGLHEDGLSAEGLPRLEKVLDLMYNAATIVLEDVSHE
ncbi:hypothetical protein [Acidipropionibacterium acidipropionici]|uniref:hypothetical protein n=1 Tax=Acidipropionibacterium acidipropionici TaxID=1748 RepID=UPI00110A0D41|nr:hypothetical protein [Acidipropionibacterium acidipropionici]QCV95732.1 hypothetical protein FEZ30_11130 [Acidipropionibacterium acidipropionici]